MNSESNSSSVIRVVWAIFSRSISKRPDGLYDLDGVGGFEVVVDSFPSQSTIPLAICFEVSAEALREPGHVLTLECVGPDGSYAGHRRTAFEARGVSALVEDELTHVEVIHFGLTLREVGRHRLIVSVDGEEAARLPLAVIAENTT